MGVRSCLIVACTGKRVDVQISLPVVKSVEFPERFGAPEHLQNHLGMRDDRRPVHVFAVAAPRIVAAERPPVMVRWISVDVSHSCEQLAVISHRHALITVLEQMARPGMPGVEVSRIAGPKLSHEAGERLDVCFHEKMRVVAHEAPGVDFRIGVLYRLLKFLDITVAVMVVFEQVEEPDASLHHVVEIRFALLSGLCAQGNLPSLSGLKANMVHGEHRPRGRRRIARNAVKTCRFGSEGLPTADP